MLAVGIALSLASGAAPALAEDDDDDGDGAGRYCSATARALFDSCQYEANDDFARARALCINVADRIDRKSCFADARLALQEGRQMCRAQNTARRELCGSLGEGRYEPNFDPARFQTDFINPVNPNPYFPLRVGNTWRFEGDGETIVVTVKNETKSIEGVTCIVVNDRVEQDGLLVEDTDDWYGLRLDRTVDYCGESVRNFERFSGDAPPLPELVDVDGSWKTGRDGDLPGTQFMGVPVAGTVYRQEFSPGNAEDAAEVRSTTYGFGQDAQLDQFAPRALVELLCNNDCVVTREFTPIEPGAVGYKYYARGLGLFLEINPQSGKVVRLVGCNVDPAKCPAISALPAP
jgi:hypothetical protein